MHKSKMGPKKKKTDEEETAERQELLEAFMKLKSGKEMDQSRLNSIKLTNTWRSLMRDLKSEEMKKDIEILCQIFERIVDRKDSIIRTLVEDVQNAEEQHRIALSGHLGNITQLIDVQKERLQIMQTDFEINKSDLVRDFLNQKDKGRKTYEQDMENMADLIYGLEKVFAAADYEYRSEFQSRTDEVKNKNMEERTQMKQQLEGQMEEIWQKMQHTMQTYQESTEERRLSYAILKEKDQKSSQTIDLQMLMIQKMSITITNLKAKITNMVKNQEEKNSSLIQDRLKMKAQFMSLKSHLQGIERKHGGYLRSHSAKTNDVLKELRSQLDQAEKIVRLGKLCAKYETEEEKILPFSEPVLTSEEQMQCTFDKEEAFKEPLAKVASQYGCLETFWRRYCKVELDRLALEKERVALVSENERLCQMLRQYLENVTVQEDTVCWADNTLLMVNKEVHYHLATAASKDPRVRSVPQVTAVDGPLMLKQLARS